MLFMEYGEPVLYFHFYTANGHPASLPMTRENKPASFPVLTGVPEQYGYRCPNCRELFFAADAHGLKHGCMNNGGIASGRA